MKGAKAVSLTAIIGIFIAALVGAALLPTIADFSVAGENTSLGANVTGAAASITALVPLFFALVILFVFVGAFVMKSRR